MVKVGVQSTLGNDDSVTQYVGLIQPPRQVKVIDGIKEEVQLRYVELGRIMGRWCLRRYQPRVFSE